MTPTKPNTGIRLAAMMVDHLIMIFMVIVLALPYVGFVVLEQADPHDTIPLVRDLSRIMLAIAAAYAVYYNKDIFNGRSLSKRIFGLQVISERSGRPADPLRCMLRNLTAFVWPLEVIATFVNPDKRLGDFIAGTRVVYYDAKRAPRPFSGTRLAMALAFTMGFTLLLLFPGQILLQSYADRNAVAFEVDSYNPELSEQLEQHVKQHFASEVDSVDFRVYDRIFSDSLPYVSGVIFVLDPDWISGDAFEAAKQEMIDEVGEKLPHEAYRGRLLFRYRAPTQFTSRQTVYNPPPHLEPVDETPMEEPHGIAFPSVFVAP